VEAITTPILPCPDLDTNISFYAALGLECTYRQRQPNPYAVVVGHGIELHVHGLDDYDPEAATGNVLVAVPDVDEMYETFAEGLRAAYGRLPAKGIPRIIRPRRRFGTVYGFSVVDPGGNWLRFSNLGDTEEAAEKRTGLLRVVDNAARHGDARGSEIDALDVLERGLARFADAPAPERAEALLYRAELAARLGRQELAAASLAEARALPLTESQREALAAEISHAVAVVDDRDRARRSDAR
jgi:catechol 2,3-dioxygenase-like lactoylglutathione lyase family enzyme